MEGSLLQEGQAEAPKEEVCKGDVRVLRGAVRSRREACWKPLGTDQRGVSQHNQEEKGDEAFLKQLLETSKRQDLGLTGDLNYQDICRGGKPSRPQAMQHVPGACRASLAGDRRGGARRQVNVPGEGNVGDSPISVAREGRKESGRKKTPDFGKAG